MTRLLVLVVLILAGLPASADEALIAASLVAGQALAAAQPKAVPMESAASQPAAYVGSRIVVEGTLENIGKNYFTDRRVVLLAPSGRYVDAIVPATQVGGPKPRLSDFLGQKVRVVGVIELRDVRRVGRTWVLVGESIVKL